MSATARIFADAAIALATIAGFAGPAPAQQSGRFSGKDLAIKFSNRGMGYDDKGQTDRAIEDYDQAIRLNPQDADAFYNRGIAYADKGQTDRAIAD
jgi:tetratricopeptide (TPR) repeat protein